MEQSHSERWGITASAPPVDPAEVETSDTAVEVVVMWGESVLHVEHVSPPREVVLRDLGEMAEPYSVVVEQAGQLFCVVPDGAEGTVTVGGTTKSFEMLRDEGKLVAHGPGASRYPLPEGATASVEHAGLTFLVKPTYAGKRAPAAAPTLSRHAWIAVSVAVHAVFLVMFYFMPPSTQALSLDTVSATDRMVEYMDAAPEYLPEEPEDVPTPDAAEESGDRGQAHEGEPGDAGREDAPQTNQRFAIEGDDQTPEMARENVRENMASTAAIGALNSLMGSWNVPTSPYGADQARGYDAFNAIGEIMGDTQGDSFGNGGLHMFGTGVGAGGTGQGTIGLDRLGTIGSCRGPRCGHGSGTGDGDYGRGVARLARREGTDVRPIQQSATIIGGLSREAIRRVVRRNVRQVRFCYEQGLQSNPSIEGRVVVSWTIDGTGRVQSSNVASTTLGNAQVESCIANAVRRWSFPQPDGGMPVGVNYPFLLRSPD